MFHELTNLSNLSIKLQNKLLKLVGLIKFYGIIKCEWKNKAIIRKSLN